MGTCHAIRYVVPVLAAVSLATPLESQTSAVAIVGATVVDVVDGRLLPNSTVVVTDDTIASVTPGGAPPPGAGVVRGEGKFLIPGLWDMHAHMEMAGEAWLALYVANGVTGIRDMGSDLDLILRMRESTAAGRMLGPRIFAAGPILDAAPREWPFRMRVTTPEEGRAAVRLLKNRGVDFVKVHNLTPRDVFFAIADEARQQNIPFAGHVPFTVTIQEGIDAGMATIEHLSEDGRVWKACSGGARYRQDLCRPFFEMLARQRVWQTPTLVAMSEIPVIGTSASAISGDHLAYANKRFLETHAGNQSFFVKRPDIVRIFKELADIGKVVTRDMAAAGVGLLAGCDSMIAGFCVHDELATMVRSGMTPLAALQAATMNPARYLGIDKTAGSVAAGKRADLVMLDANPFADVANVRRIHAVVAGGRVHERKELDDVLARVKAAASASMAN